MIHLKLGLNDLPGGLHDRAGVCDDLNDRVLPDGLDLGADELGHALGVLRVVALEHYGSVEEEALRRADEKVDEVILGRVIPAVGDDRAAVLERDSPHRLLRLQARHRRHRAVEKVTAEAVRSRRLVRRRRGLERPDELI